MQERFISLLDNAIALKVSSIVGLILLVFLFSTFSQKKDAMSEDAR